jgi:peptidyl-prolyl cis-trans isomerase SurA
MRRLIVCLILSGAVNGAVVIDRIAVIAGKHVIKLSDIDRDLRVTAFLNRGSSAETPDAKRKSADRLVDQQIIRDELVTGGYGRATDADASAMLQQIRQSRFGGSDARLKQSMAQYGLTEAQIQSQLLWQLTALRFIDQRFRAGVLVTDEEVRAYYDAHPELQKTPFDKAAAPIRTTLEGEQINKEFEAWLESARKGERIEYRDEAFGGEALRGEAGK